MRRTLFVAPLAACALGGCYQIPTWQERQVEMIEAKGGVMVREFDPWLAGGLNILPGVGDAYCGQWGAFAGNLLLWPLSVVWGIPGAATSAVNLNKEATWDYYASGPGRGQFDFVGIPRGSAGWDPTNAGPPPEVRTTPEKTGVQ